MGGCNSKKAETTKRPRTNSKNREDKKRAPSKRPEDPKKMNQDNKSPSNVAQSPKKSNQGKDQHANNKSQVSENHNQNSNRKVIDDDASSQFQSEQTERNQNANSSPRKLHPQTAAKKNDNIEENYMPSSHEMERILQFPPSKFDPYFIEACVKGRVKLVEELINQKRIRDISRMNGYVNFDSSSISFGNGVAKRTFDNMASWNPLLLSIAFKQCKSVAMLFELIPGFHALNCLGKPYPHEIQKEKVFDHNRRLKRECFGLKLAILNRDGKTFQYLWNENGILWNLGHFFYCMNQIIKSGWENGVKILLQSPTSKVIFMSVNKVSDFIDAVDVMREHLATSEKFNKQLCQKFRESLETRPYFIYCLFLEIASYNERPNAALIKKCLEKLQADDIQFKHSDLDEIFQVFDEENMLIDEKDQFFAKFENRDQEIEEMQEEMVDIFKNYKPKPSQNYDSAMTDQSKHKQNKEDHDQEGDDQLDLLEDLDLFAFNTFKIKGRETNILIEALNQGNEKITEFIFSEGFANIRGLLKQNNSYEFENEVAQFDISYFLSHAKNLGIFTRIYHLLIDVMQLSNFLEIIMNCLGVQMSSVVSGFESSTSGQALGTIEFLFNDVKFKSLFASSLELQKFIFTKEVIEMFKGAGQNNLLNLLKQEPYAQYFSQIKKGYAGEDFAKKTIEYFDKLMQEQQQQSQSVNREDSVRHSKLIGIGAVAMMRDSYASNHNPRASINMPRESVGPKTGAGIILLKKAGTGNSPKNDFEIKDIPRQTLSKIDTLQERRTQRQSVRMSYRENEGAPSGYTTLQQQELNVVDENEEINDSPLILNQKLLVAAAAHELIDSDRDSNGRRKKKKKNKKTKKDKKKKQVTQEIVEERKTENSYDMDNDSPEKSNMIVRATVTKQPLQADDNEEINYQRMLIPRKSRKTEMGLDFDIEQVPTLLIEAIKSDDVNKVQTILSQAKIANVAQLKYQNQDQFVPVKGSTTANSSTYQSQNNAKYDTTLWNPVLFAIYYQRLQILKILLEKYTINFILALRLPPVNEFTEYIIPASQQATHATVNRQTMHDNNDPYTMRPSMRPSEKSMNTPYPPATATVLGLPLAWQGYHQTQSNNMRHTENQTPQYYYNPSDAKTECFGLELAIRNKDKKILEYLWEQQSDKWEEKHFAYVFEKMLQEKWDQGIDILFSSKTSHVIYKGLNPEDKDNFLNSKIIDKITDTEYWENSPYQPIKVTAKQKLQVFTQLQSAPYGSYACLKFPQMFLKYEMLSETLPLVNLDDIYDFTVGRKENILHFANFVQNFKVTSKSEGKMQTLLQGILNKAQQTQAESRRLPPSPEKLVLLIKIGDIEVLKRYLNSDDNSQLLELLNQLQGYEDSDYISMYNQSVKIVPADDTIQLLLADNTTFDWNPLIFSIFYQKLEFVKYFCEHPSVFLRNCLTTPFIIETNGDGMPDPDQEEHFIKEKTELFAIVLTIMLQDREMFAYLWQKCSFIYNDIHLVILANYMFDSQWLEGVKILFKSEATQQIFGQMNLYEKEKFLKFCDKSASKAAQQICLEFRIQMAFDPYNIYYLPILAQPEDIQYWLHSSADEPSKEEFMKNCEKQFDERSFKMLNKYNNHYVNEFISTAINTESQVLKNFARKLKRYQGSNVGVQQQQMLFK